MVTGPAFAVAVDGLLLGLSLIVSVGPQNLFVLRQGAKRDRVLLVVGICTVSDVLLIAAGVGGDGAVLAGHPMLTSVMRDVGAAFVLGYGGLAARRALSGPSQVAVEPTPTSSTRVATACLAFTWLNPTTYLDTVVAMGSVATTHPGHQWWFAVGAVAGSAAWFSGVGFGARFLAPLLHHPRSGQVLDALVAVVMAFTGVRMLGLV